MKTSYQIIASCQEKIKVLQEMVVVSNLSRRLSEIDDTVNSSNIWNDPKGAAGLMKERQKLSDIITQMSYFGNQIDFYTEVLEAMPEELNKASPQLAALEQKMLDFEFQQMMKDPVDDTTAIVSISAGAGGLESANFVTMLLRMYCRYADCYNLKTEILHRKDSEEHSSICTDSVSISIQGAYAYGFLKGESGVHRLIRNSPFNSGDARHTSFAAVSVTPDIEDTIDIKIEEKDLDIVCQTAGGPGGQHSNKVSSAVRLKHIPSGINILVRTERDQHANRRTAMKMLKAKLYDLEMKRKKEEKDKQVGQQSSASFGSQIRTYTLTPYTLVKDHRTDYGTNNAEGVLDGDIREFLLSHLRSG